MSKIKEGYIRVTEILSQWDFFGHIDPMVLERKRNIGTEVHMAIDADSNGVFMPINDSAQGYFNSYILWKESGKKKLICNEQRLYCDKLKITGAFDAIYQMGGDVPTMIDYKCSSKENPVIWPLQGTFYHYLAVKKNILVGEDLLFVRLQKDGSVAKEYRYKYSADLLDVCMNAYYTYINVYQRLNIKKPQR